MKKIINLFQQTLIRGILFLVPILVVLVVIDRALDKLKELANPIADILPYHSVFGVGKAYWAVLLILLFVGIVMGIIARFAVATKFSNWIEHKLLYRIPGYSFMKQMGESMIGVDDKKVFRVVLLSIEEFWQLAYLIEEINDTMVAVYVPSVPNPQEGDLFYVSKERIKETTISYKDSMRIINCQGRGSARFLKDLI